MQKGKKINQAIAILTDSLDLPKNNGSKVMAEVRRALALLSEGVVLTDARIKAEGEGNK